MPIVNWNLFQNCHSESFTPVIVSPSMNTQGEGSKFFKGQNPRSEKALVPSSGREENTTAERT